jgi:hypothetical protein
MAQPRCRGAARLLLHRRGMWITTPEPALPPELAALITLGWITLGLVLIRVLSRPNPRG